MITKEGIQNHERLDYRMSDPTTQSNYLDIATRHFSLEWMVDFEAQTISGKAVYELEVRREGVHEVMCVFTLVVVFPAAFGLARGSVYTLSCS